MLLQRLGLADFAVPPGRCLELARIEGCIDRSRVGAHLRRCRWRRGQQLRLPLLSARKRDHHLQQGCGHGLRALPNGDDALRLRLRLPARLRLLRRAGKGRAPALRSFRTIASSG